MILPASLLAAALAALAPAVSTGADPAAGPQGRTPVPDPLEEALELAGEARWERWERIRADDDERRRFLRLLAQRGEHAFLEAIQVHADEAWTEVGAYLAGADAPQWIRTAVWMLRRQDSHGFDNAKKALERRGDVVLPWLEAHPAALEAEPVRALLEALDVGGAVRGDASRYLPPLDPAAVFEPLDPAARFDAPDPGGGVPEGARSLPALERAVTAFALWARHPEPWRGRLIALARHPQPEVRQVAYLAFSHFRPDEVPVDVLWDDVQDTRLAPELREAALFGWSYGPDPLVYLRLHGIALDPAHPAWRAAVSRLGDLGDGFSLQCLAGIGEAALGVAEAELLRDERARIAERVAVLDPAARVERARPTLERAAWAALAGHPLAGELEAWMRAEVSGWARDPDVRAALEELAASYEPAPGLEHGIPAGSLRARVRAAAGEILADARAR